VENAPWVVEESKLRFEMQNWSKLYLVKFETSSHLGASDDYTPANNKVKTNQPPPLELMLGKMLMIFSNYY